MNVLPAAPSQISRARAHAWGIVLIATACSTLIFLNRSSLVQINNLDPATRMRPMGSPGSLPWRFTAFECAHGLLFAVTTILAARVAGMGNRRWPGQMLAVMLGLSWGLWWQKSSSEFAWWWLMRDGGRAGPTAIEWTLVMTAAGHSLIASAAMYAFTGSWRVLLAAIGLSAAAALANKQSISSGPGGPGDAHMPFVMSAWHVGVAGILAPWAFASRRRVLEGLSGKHCLNCGYSLSGLTGGSCPECGAALPAESGKALIRTQMRQALALIAPDRFALWSGQIRERIGAHPAWKSARTVFVFDPMRREVDLGPLIDQAIAEGKTVAVPACDWKSCDMTPVVITSRDADLVMTDRQMREPRPGLRAIEPAAIDLVLAPGLAFDEHGWRLGRGRGFYDRFLARVTPPTRVFGVAFDAQVVPKVPAEAFDARVEGVFTESGLRMTDV